MKKILLLISLMLLSGCASKLEVKVLKIGQADNIILEKDNKIVMIDLGEEDDSSEIISYLSSKNISKIDKLIISHFDKDHIGGQNVLKSVEVGEIYMPDYDFDSTLYQSLIQLIKDKGIKNNIVTDDTMFDFNDIVYYLYPSKREYNSNFSNNNSLITKVINNKVSMLFLGDIMEERINEIIDTEYLKSNLLKVPHHGALESNSYQLFDKIKPDYSIITCSLKNKEDQSLSNYLQKIGSRVLLTRKGDITCQSNGRTLACYN